jgi:anhydro-N-acetylmuramic acid kinase
VQGPALLAQRFVGGTGFRVAAVRRAIGLMSGTSLDGVDVALIETDGERVARFGPARTFPYAEADRAIFRAAFRDALQLTDRTARPGILAEADALVTVRHAETVEDFLEVEGIRSSDIDLVGFHGQTVLHDPQRALTVQIGDGNALAERLRTPVAWDFRARDMEAGGQGAPLAPIFHHALAAAAGVKKPVVFLNLGGVANVTYIGEGGELIAFDTGPGNALLDDWTRERTGAAFDRDGMLAASGRYSPLLLAAYLEMPYFDLAPPKSLDRNQFPVSGLANLSDAEGAATLLQLSARSVACAVEHFPERPRCWYASGGGRHNIELMRAIAAALGDMPLEPLETLGFDGDATEAQAFAFLAVRTLDGLPLSFPLTTGVPAPMPGGRISRPRLG